MSSLSNILTKEELEILNTFRKTVEDILQPKHDDHYLLLWLRARNFKLNDAEDMLRKHMEWRKLARADDVLQTYKRKEVCVKYWPEGLIGTDKSGCPIWLIRIGNADLKGLVYSLTRSETMSEFTYFLELTISLIKQKSVEIGVQVEGGMGIVDMENISLYFMTSAPVITRSKDIMHWFEANYPESLKSIYIINAPTFMKMIMTFLKSILNEKTFKKIHVYGRDDWKEKLLEEIDETVLPVKYGGKRVGPNNDVSGFDLVPEGGTVPKSYYIQRRLSNEDEAKVVEVSAGKFYLVEVLVEKPKSILNWEFKTKDHNISFGLFYVINGDLEEIIPSEKQNCHVIPENGIWLCTKAGTYALKFDNSYSWIRSKSVSYWTEVLPPQNE